MISLKTTFPLRPDATILNRIAKVRAPLEQLAASFAYGKIVHEGLTLAIVGPPERRASRASSIAWSSASAPSSPRSPARRATWSAKRSPSVEFLCRLVDTAGIRRALDEAESIGIKKSMEALADADLVLVVLDASQPVSEEDHELLRQVEGRPAIVVANKCDLTKCPVRQVPVLSCGMVPTSALTGEGIAELRRLFSSRLAEKAARKWKPDS